MKKTTIAKIALFLTAAFWGSTFTISKLATEAFSASFIIACRFLIASAVLLIAAFPQRKQLNRKYLIDGFWMGLTLYISYVLQVTGLTMDTSPGKSAFLCTTYSVMVPFIHWLITRERPKVHHILCVFLCLAGVGILSLSGGWRMSTGDILTVLSGLPCAINIVLSSRASKNKNVLLLTCVELCSVTVFAWIFVFTRKEFPVQFPLDAVGGVVYLGLLATALCLYMQAFGLKYAEPAIGGMIISLESVFGVVFSMIVYHERITLRMIVGFAVIFAAILLSQWNGKKRLSDQTV